MEGAAQPLRRFPIAELPPADGAAWHGPKRRRFGAWLITSGDDRFGFGGTAAEAPAAAGVPTRTMLPDAEDDRSSPASSPPAAREGSLGRKPLATRATSLVTPPKARPGLLFGIKSPLNLCVPSKF